MSDTVDVNIDEGLILIVLLVLRQNGSPAATVDDAVAAIIRALTGKKGND